MDGALSRVAGKFSFREMDEESLTQATYPRVLLRFLGLG
jgi:hypothetical protein